MTTMGTTITSNVHNVTPEKAAAWLQKNRINRPLDKNRVSLYASEMSTNQWRLTHEGIAFDQEGWLLDGQHRLHAVIKSGATVQTLVFGGCPSDSFAYINTAKSRTAGDILAIQGVKNPTAMAAIAKAILLWQDGAKAVTVNAKTNKKMTNPQIMEYVASDSTIEDACRIARRFHGAYTGISVSQLGLMCWLWLRCANEDAITGFLEKWKKGANLGEKDPIYLLREAIRKDQDNGSRLYTFEKYSLILQSWFYYRNKKSLSKLARFQYTEINPNFLQKFIV